MIEYKNSLNGITPENLKGFFVGWPNPPSLMKHYKILENSAYFWVAIDSQSGDVVGFITAISDGVLSAFIPLIEVLPDYQGKGIGKRLMENMLSTLKAFYMVDLLCDQELQVYYDKFDMIRSQGMIIRNYQNQSGI